MATQAASPGLKDAVDFVWGSIIEPPFVLLGLHTQPVKRFGVVALASAGLLLTFQPESMFYRGRPRPSKLFSQSKEATYMDFITTSLFFGGLSVLLV